MSDPKLNLLLTADDKTAAAFNALNNRLQNVERTTKKVSSSFGDLKKVGAQLFAGVELLSAVKSIASVADTYKQLNARIKVVSDSTAEFEIAQRALFQISQATRTGFAETADLYAQMARGLKDLNVPQGTMLRLTEGINKAVIVSGTSTQAANAALIQLGQGFASGALRGQEFMSVQEQAPVILETVRKGLGLTQGELKKLAEEGQLTNTIFIEGFMKGMSQLDNQFKQMPVTIGQAVQQMKNSFTVAIGSLDKLTGSSEKAANSISSLSKYLQFMSKTFDDISGLKSMSDLAGQLSDAEKELKKYNWMLERAKKSGLDYSEVQRRQAEAQERFNRALYKFRGAEFSGQMAPPLALIPKKPPVIITKEQQKEIDKYNQSIVDAEAKWASSMTSSERQARNRQKVIDDTVSSINKMNKASVSDYVAGRSKRQQVMSAEFLAIQEVVENSKTPLEKYRDSILSIDDSLQNLAVGAMKNMEDAFVGLISGTMSAKDAFRSMASSIISDLIRMQIQQSITKPLAGLLGGMFGGAQSVPLSTSGPAYSSAAWAASNSSWAASGARASGGPVTGGKTYLVGERGPELFTASSSGNITPNNQLGGGGVTVVQNINVSTGVQQTVRAEVMSLMPQIANAAKAAVADAKLRGGGFAAAMR